MKITFDTDGTKTDFAAFVHAHEGYFKEKYNMDLLTI